MENGLPLETSLSILDRVGLRDVIVVHDTQAPNRSLVADAIRRHRNRFRRFDVVEVTEFETGKRWLAGIRRAFHRGADVVFLCPGDFTSKLSESRSLEKFITGCRDMLGQASRNRLVMGDYEVTEHFKEDFDTLITRPAVDCLYPQLTHRLNALGLTKMRTEFFALGRVYFDEFMTAPFQWSADPTVQLLLAGLLDPGSLEIVSVDLGDWFRDDSHMRSPLGQLYQAVRMVFSLAVDRLRLEQQRGLPPTEQIEVCRQINTQLRQLTDQLLSVGRDLLK